MHSVPASTRADRMIRAASRLMLIVSLLVLQGISMSRAQAQVVGGNPMISIYAGTQAAYILLPSQVLDGFIHGIDQGCYIGNVPPPGDSFIYQQLFVDGVLVASHTQPIAYGIQNWISDDVAFDPSTLSPGTHTVTWRGDSYGSNGTGGPWYQWTGDQNLWYVSTTYVK